MSQIFTLSGQSSTLFVDFYNALVLDHRHYDYSLALIGLHTYNSVLFNNKFAYREFDSESKVINIPTGAYELGEIEAFLQKHLIPSDVPESNYNNYFSLKPNNNTLKCEIKSRYEIDFTYKDNIAELLGFSPQILHANTLHQSDLPVRIVRVATIRVDCNITTGAYYNSKPLHTIFEFGLKVDPGYAIDIEPKNLIFLPVNNQTDIHNITLRVLDQNGELVNFQREEIIMRDVLEDITIKEESLEYAEEDYLEDDDSKAKTDLKRLCDICHKYFSSVSARNAHIMAIHSDDKKKFKCNQCSSSFIFKSLLKEHLNTHTRSVRYLCKFCPKVFYRKMYADKHQEQHKKAGETGINCGECNVWCKNQTALYRHKKTHNVYNYSCDFCSKSFQHLRNLLVHKTGHNEAGILNCPYCDHVANKTTEFRSHLTTHKEKLNDKFAAKFACNKCTVVCTNASSLAKHQSQYHQSNKKNFACEHCKASFFTSTQMKQHVYNQHIKEKMHKCEFCKKRFVFECRLTSHMKTHSEERNFECSICGIKYKRNISLRNHMKKMH